MDRIYVDHAATTPLEPEVREAMLPWLGGQVGNASSIHHHGLQAKKAIDEAREAVASALGCLFGEVIFTGSGSEAMNLALLGLALGNKDASRRVFLISAAEHHCALHCQPMLERLGYSVRFLPVDRMARVLPFEATPDVLAVVSMHANNEFGTLCSPDFGGAIGVCDIVQTFGQMPISVDELGCDLAITSAHKLGGPQGVGALYIRAGTPMEALIRGGGQERDMRAGTESVANIVGFGAAVRLALDQMGARKAAKAACTEAFWDEMSGAAFEVVRTATGERALAGHAHFRIPGVPAEPLLIGLDQLGVSASSGAACSSGSLEPSHVMLAAGYSEKEASEAIRITFGWSNTPDEAREVARRLIRVAERILAAKGKT